MKENINWSTRNISEVEFFFSTDVKRGLENSKYRKARQEYGANIIRAKVLEKQNFYGLEKKRANLKTLLSQAVSIFGVIYIFLIIILKIMDSGVNIYTIVPFWGLSVLITLFLSMNAEKKRMQLFKRTRPKALVIRNGTKKKVLIESIVPGDVLILSAGDIVPADARLVAANSLSCIEITGDNRTAHINKTAKTLDLSTVLFEDEENITIADSNIVFATDLIVSGSGLAIVIATGNNTRIIRYFGSSEQGDYAKQREDEYEASLSMLQKDSASITRKFSLFSISFAMALLIFEIFFQRDLSDSLLISFTVVASMFADKLPAIADFAMAQGMRTLAGQGILIKKAAVVDVLNRSDTLIAKKNETFMRDALEARKIYYDHWNYNIESKNTFKIGQILSYMALCTSVGKAKTKRGDVVYTGSSVDVAVVEAFLKCNLNFAGLNAVYQKFGKITYNPYSGSKSTLVYIKSQNKFLLIYFGEARTVLERCARRSASMGYIDIDRRSFDVYARKIHDLYKSYDLVMAVATKECSGDVLINPLNDEIGLDFEGIISFSESGVLGVYESIDYLKKSGVSPVMIVDADNSITQRSARRLGILAAGHDGESQKILDDTKIAKMGDGAFYANAHKYRLFMPMSIQNRVKFLKALRFRKKVSAVTVTDLSELALLDESDMSLVPVTAETGVLITRASAVLQNLSISTISKAVKGAVLIYRNAHNAISFSAALFTAQYLLTFFALISDGAYLLNAVQMMWAGIAVGYVYAIAMCFSEDTTNWYVYRRVLKDYERCKRKSITSGIISGIVIFFAVVSSFVICLAFEGMSDEMKISDAILGYIGSARGEPSQYILSARTGAFTSLIFSCFATAVINIKPTYLTDLKILKNPVFVIGTVINMTCLVAVLLIPPLREFFEFAPLSVSSLAAVILTGSIIPSAYLLLMIKSEKKRGIR